MWRKCIAASRCVARPIRNDDSTEKIPRAMVPFFARAHDFDLDECSMRPGLFALCFQVALCWLLAGRPPLEFPSGFFQDVAG
jgi:hypothetical protein